MNQKKLLTNISLAVSASSVVVSLYIFSEETLAISLPLKVVLVYFLAMIVSLFWVSVIGYRSSSTAAAAIESKTKEAEQLLFDIRDGTRHFYKEKRRAIRIKTIMTAQLLARDIKNFVKVLDLSSDGALLTTDYNLRPGELIDFKLYLPLFALPITIKAEVVRVQAIPAKESEHSQGASLVFNVGVRYVDMPDQERRMLEETLEVIAKPAPSKTAE